MYICMWIDMYMYIHIYVYICVYIYVYIYTNIRTFTYIFKKVRVFDFDECLGAAQKDSTHARTALLTSIDSSGIQNPIGSVGKTFIGIYT
jgi:hypothetical protein